MKFLSSGVAVCLYKTAIRPCTKYCCHIWAGAPRCFLDVLDKLQKEACGTVGTSFAASLKALVHR